MTLVLKKRKKQNKAGIIVFIITLSFIASYFFILYFSNQISPIFMSYAESETRKLMTLIINKAVTKQLASGMELENLYTITQNQNGDIELIDFNSVTVTKILNVTTSLVQLNLKALEEGNIDLIELPENSFSEYDEKLLKKGIIYEIPFGTITKTSLLSNLGPKIPVRFQLVGDVVSGLETQVKEYGINNAMIELGVNITVSSRINLPFLSKEISVSTVIPISMKIIQGKIPEFYAGGFLSQSNLVESTS